MSTYSGPEIITTNFSLCLDAGNKKSYPGSGTTWTDLSSNGIIATLTNSPTFTNNYFSFNGTSNYITVASNAAYAFGSNGTIENWIYVSGNSGTNNRLFCVNNNSSSIDCYLNGATYNVGFHGGTVTTTSTIPTNQWVHFVITYNSGTIAVYFNGISQGLTGTTTGYNITNNGALLLGQFSGGGNYYFNGSLAITKIYNRALTTTEISQHFIALRGRFGI